MVSFLSCRFAQDKLHPVIGLFPEERKAFAPLQAQLKALRLARQGFCSSAWRDWFPVACCEGKGAWLQLPKMHRLHCIGLRRRKKTTMRIVSGSLHWFFCFVSDCNVFLSICVSESNLIGPVAHCILLEAALDIELAGDCDSKGMSVCAGRGACDCLLFLNGASSWGRDGIERWCVTW